jgi:hypothetical protein
MVRNTVRSSREKEQRIQMAPYIASRTFVVMLQELFLDRDASRTQSLYFQISHLVCVG